MRKFTTKDTKDTKNTKKPENTRLAKSGVCSPNTRPHAWLLRVDDRRM